MELTELSKTELFMKCDDIGSKEELKIEDEKKKK